MAICHKELIQNHSAGSDLFKTFRRINQGAVCWTREHLFSYNQQKSVIKVQNASSCSSSWFGLPMFWVTFVWSALGLPHSVIRDCGIAEVNRLFTIMAQISLNSFASLPPPAASISFFYLPVNISCWQSVSECDRLFTKAFDQRDTVRQIIAISEMPDFINLLTFNFKTVYDLSLINELYIF